MQDSGLEPYNYNLNVKEVQKLRGLVQYWKNTNLFWKTTIQAIDMLLPYVDATGTRFACACSEVWKGFWGMCTVLRSLSAFSETVE